MSHLYDPSAAPVDYITALLRDGRATVGRHADSWSRSQSPRSERYAQRDRDVVDRLTQLIHAIEAGLFDQLDYITADVVDPGPVHCMLHNTPPIPTGEQCPLCLATASADARAAEENAVDAPALIPRSREHAVMGQLLPMMADIPTATWQINTGKIEIQSRPNLPDGEVRPAMRAIAASLPGFDYREVEYVHMPHVSVEAYAVIDGVKVRIWDHAKPAAQDRQIAEADAIGARLNASFPYYLDGTRIQDEDQSATPARGHGQDGEVTAEVMDAIFGEPVEGRDYDVMPDDEPVTHVPNLSGSMPRCGAGEDDPVYSNRPTCPACRSLRPLKRRGATTPPTGDRP